MYPTVRRGEQQADRHTAIPPPHISEGMSRVYKWSVAILALLCLLLVAAISVLGIDFHRSSEENAENARLLSNYSDLKTQLEALQRSHSSLWNNYSDLQMDYMNISESKKKCTRVLAITSELERQLGEMKREYSHLLGECSALQRIHRNLTGQYLLKDKCLPKQKFCTGGICEFCSTNWVRFSGKCYFFSPDTMSWYSSRDDCKLQGGSLVIIESREEQDFLLKRMKRVPGTAWDYYWIGLYSFNSGEQWRWVDRTALQEGYWRRGQPTDSYYEGCVLMNPREHFQNNWRIADCSKYKYRRVCETRAVRLIV
ncbi:C-type lectin domain family 4 member A-like [Huso huso]|uniref:C-type lectin domain family 4 member A-like n=1 Tax=Huso huso TaxID=61971 RepID=A0ABR0ZES7_HUSHU